MVKKTLFSKSGLSKTKSQNVAVRQADSYHRKSRNFLMRLRESQRHPETQKIASPNVSQDQLEILSYQARFGVFAMTRKEGLEGLVMIDQLSKITLLALEIALDDEDPEVRVKTVELISSYDESIPDSLLDKLIERAWDPDVTVRRAVAYALTFHPDPRSIGPLMGLLGTRDDELRQIVEESLNLICEKLGPPPPIADGDA